VGQGRLIAEFVDHAIVPLAMIALIYILMNYGLSRLAVFLERWLATRGQASTGKLPDQHDPDLDRVVGNAGA